MKKILVCSFAALSLMLASCSGGKSENSADSSLVETQAAETEVVNPYQQLYDNLKSGQKMTDENYMEMLSYMMDYMGTAKAECEKLGPFSPKKRAEYGQLNKSLAEQYPYMADFSRTVIEAVQSATIPVSEDVVNKYMEWQKLAAECRGVKWN